MDRWQEDLDRIQSWRETDQRLLDAVPTNDRDALWREMVLASVAESQELNDELRELGIPFAMDELANVRAPYPEAIPILLKHLKRRYLANNEEMLIRALTVPYGGNEVFEALLDHLYRRRADMRDSSLYALGNALAVTAEKGHVGKLVQVAIDNENGGAIMGPLRRLAQIKHLSVEGIARGLLARGRSPRAAIQALRRVGATSAIEDVRPYLSSKDGELRAEARKYFAKVGAT